MHRRYRSQRRRGRRRPPFAAAFAATFAAAVQRIVHNWMADALEMKAQLVAAACDRLTEDEGRVGHRVIPEAAHDRRRVFAGVGAHAVIAAIGDSGAPG